MRAETFFEKFDLFADAPNGVEKLRSLVLSLAVQGRLVKQSDLDGTADEIVAEIGQRDPTVREAEVRKSELLQLGESSRSIPDNWRWVRVKGICQLQIGKRMKGGARDSGVISLGGEHLRPTGTVDYSVPRHVSRDFFNRMRSGRVALHDTLMVKDGATTGKTAFVEALPHDGCAAVNEHVFILRWREPIDKRLAYYFIRALSAGQIAAKSAGVIGGIRRSSILDLPFPLPPSAEQKRIAAKLDSLMDLCDRLELQQEEKKAQHAQLTRASLARFSNAPTLANLDLLFHHSCSVSPHDLRKAILALALGGKLVPQDPNDSAADQLLLRILKERRELKRTTSSRVRVYGPATALSYEIPSAWRWQKLEDLLVFGPTNGTSPKAVEHETPVRSLTLSATTSGRFKGECSKFVPIEVPPDSDLWLRDGDILVQRGNTIDYVGVSAVYRGKRNRFIYPDLMMKIRVSQAIDVDFVHLAMSSEPCREYLRQRASGTSGSMPKINQATLKSLPIPVPPLAEQRRIVARADQLMALVDRLEAQLEERRNTSIDLMDAATDQIAS